MGAPIQTVDSPIIQVPQATPLSQATLALRNLSPATSPSRIQRDPIMEGTDLVVIVGLETTKRDTMASGTKYKTL